ncbi:FUSC family protein [Pollutimonas sp. M17]|uniref:FUSC family protein n=1 Tax=Pollutimonas sp. M17 TaxID=2962065 RepID=UPI0021F4D76B|nr:FUSC family protein [Pollutimonas sp. M17]UYO94649.1 FUSC family protein [Pollutimonas sp. M17]
MKAPALKWIRKHLQTDEVRIPIQTASAVFLAYFATSFFMEVEDVSWGVFSALFVVQASIGGTIGAALGRIAGAALGAVIAVALVMLLGTEGWDTLIALLAGVGIMSFLAAKWPVLAYGLVTVAIIAVAPDFYIVEGALKKVLAIAIGSSCGMVAAFAVFPVLARRTEQEHLATALRNCGDYVLECTTCLVRDKRDKDRKAQNAIQRSIEQARLMAREARIEEKTPAMGLSPFSQALLPEIERFAYTLTLVDRFSDKPISDMRDDDKKALLELAGTVRNCLEEIADAVEAGKPCQEIDDVEKVYRAFEEQVDASIKHGGFPVEDEEHMVSIKSAYGSVLSNLAELARQARGRPHPAGPGQPQKP